MPCQAGVKFNEYCRAGAVAFYIQPCGTCLHHFHLISRRHRQLSLQPRSISYRVFSPVRTCVCFFEVCSNLFSTQVLQNKKNNDKQRFGGRYVCVGFVPICGKQSMSCVSWVCVCMVFQFMMFCFIWTQSSLNMWICTTCSVQSPAGPPFFLFVFWGYNWFGCFSS